MSLTTESDSENVFLNPLYTILHVFFPLVLYHKFGIVHCIYLGVSGYNLKKIVYSFVLISFYLYD